MRGGADQIMLDHLAAEIEEDLGVLMEAASIQNAVEALRRVNGLCARVNAEYGRMGLKPLFT